MEVYTHILIQTVFKFDASQKAGFKKLHHLMQVYY